MNPLSLLRIIYIFFSRHCYACSNIFIDVTDGQSHEVITRYTAGMKTTGDWTTDSNCAESQLRRRNFRKMWDINPSEAVTGVCAYSTVLRSSLLAYAFHFLCVIVANVPAVFM